MKIEVLKSFGMFSGMGLYWVEVGRFEGVGWGGWVEYVIFEFRLEVGEIVLYVGYRGILFFVSLFWRRSLENGCWKGFGLVRLRLIWVI